MSLRCGLLLALSLIPVGCFASDGTGTSKAFDLQLRYQQPTAGDSDRYHRLHRHESWQAAKTAVIVCDMWDSHHCYRAVQRGAEMAPRLNAFLEEARAAGATIIHAPSGCMEAYADHPARQRALAEPTVGQLPPEINSWCYSIPAEERAEYPIDQSGGGEDDTPEEHAQWEQELIRQGRDPDAPWLKQTDQLDIDADKDFVSDQGDEIWSILANRGIDNVMLTGVHTNMCVLGRPFGLRQMARNGKNVVLVRDLTDTMYNPAAAPYVSHFTGTDLIIDHIERHVCPTITSVALLGGEPFEYAADQRPHLVMVIAEDEYRTEQSLPQFALEQLGKDYRVSIVHGDEEERNRIPGLEVLNDADAVLFSVRRRVLPPADMERIKRYVAAGRTVLGIRTASHAFSLRGNEPPDGFVAWPDFDAHVFGGNYTNHYGNKLESQVQVAPSAGGHPILLGLDGFPFKQGGSLYKTSPLAEGAELLLIGSVEGAQPEPVAWTFTRQDGGRSFYTSLGHVDDFENPVFIGLMKNAIDWAVKATANADDQ